PLLDTCASTCPRLASSVLSRVLIPLPFFFQSSVHHRTPHSFPTRRSSDLKALARMTNEVRRIEISPVLVVKSVPRPPMKSPRSRDRKSTRLNSSHQIISYAVFCLKKKKKTNG